MIPPRKHVQEDNVDSWLMSYADMITLLMCFFIIFVSVSEPKRDKFSRVTQGIASKFGSVDLSTPFMGAFQQIQTVVEEHKIFRDVAVEKTDRSVEMELSTGAFFLKDAAELDPQRMDILAELVSALKTLDFIDYRITIEGHTSNEPSKLYPSNWELSTARAARMVRFLIEKGIRPNRLKAVGLADTDPKVANRNASGASIPENQEQNERMVIKLERAL